MSRKVIRLALYNRRSGAQGCTYYGTLKYVYRIVKPDLFKLPETREELEELKRQGIIEFVRPIDEKIEFESYSDMGGVFHKEFYAYYVVEAPALVHKVYYHEGKRDDVFMSVDYDINEEKAPEYTKPFADIIAEAEKIDNRSGIPIEELRKLRCRRIGVTRDNLHGDDFDEFELENGCTATLFYRRTLSADVGYRFDYTKLLRIYPPPRK